MNTYYDDYAATRQSRRAAERAASADRMRRRTHQYRRRTVLRWLPRILRGAPMSRVATVYLYIATHSRELYSVAQVHALARKVRRSTSRTDPDPDGLTRILRHASAARADAERTYAERRAASQSLAFVGETLETDELLDRIARTAGRERLQRALRWHARAFSSAEIAASAEYHRCRRAAFAIEEEFARLRAKIE